ncbi:MAG: hypothetical protein RL375_2437 [Pseudomonadota bacterium]|jgi:hypothetical protein
MAYYFPEGSRVYYSSTFASAKTISAATNANPASLTSTSHGYVDGDIFLFTSGWEDANARLFKADQQDANTFTALGLNTTSTTYFPAGSGTGTTQIVSSWVEMPQVLNINATGGGPRYATIEPLASRNPIQQFVSFEPVNITITLGHDPSNATYLSMLDLSRTATNVGIKIVGGSGGVAYGYGQISVSEVWRMQRGQANAVDVALSGIRPLISYSS